MPEIKKDERDRRERDERVDESAAKKTAEPISEITHRLGEKRINLSFANVGRDLPFALGRRAQSAAEASAHVVIKCRPIPASSQAASTLFKHSAPTYHSARRAHQASA